LLGLNKLVTIKRSKRTIKPSGTSSEETEILAMHVPAAIQPYVLRTMPPPPQFRTPGGELYKQYYGCWIPCGAVSVPILDDDIVEDETTGERYDVMAVVDAAGRGHHWLLRLRKFH
jgi:hypothetical protein